MFTCLCALFSARAQSPELRAVELERLIFDGADLETVNSALLEKADCYSQLGRYEDASSTLERVRMFALTDEERAAVQYKQELMYYMAGNFVSAAALVSEVEPVNQDIALLHALVLAYAGRYDESEIMAARCLSWNGPSEQLDGLLALYRQHPPVRSAATAMALSFIPPVGHFYNEAYGEGLLSLGLNGASVAFVAANLLGGYWVTGLLGGAVLLNYTFMGNIERNQKLTAMHQANDPVLFGERVRAFMQEALK